MNPRIAFTMIKTNNACDVRNKPTMIGLTSLQFISSWVYMPPQPSFQFQLLRYIIQFSRRLLHSGTLQKSLNQRRCNDCVMSVDSMRNWRSLTLRSTGLTLVHTDFTWQLISLTVQQWLESAVTHKDCNTSSHTPAFLSTLSEIKLSPDGYSLPLKTPTTRGPFGDEIWRWDGAARHWNIV